MKSKVVDLSVVDKKAILVGTYLTSDLKEQCTEQLEELQYLGNTFGLCTQAKMPCPLRKIDAGTFLGKGKVEELHVLALDQQCDVVVFDDEISPQQQKNLEKAIGCNVIDRTELILGVFAQKAQTREAKLQIELASLRYQLPRLRRLWTHLSRQRVGGKSGGYLKGEGEKQIEIDRRIVRQKIAHIEKEIAEVRKHRNVQRKARERNQVPTFAIVGYTNAGKSTLLNALTNADVLVEDKLFSTLDTTTRKFVLPNQQPILLIDTVGFIRKIPHQLVAAFKSTLEEAVKADILLHLIDASNPNAALQAEAVLDILKELGAAKKPMITVVNKMDLCANRLEIDRFRFTYPKTVVISALNKEGLDRLMELMIGEIALLRKVVTLRVPQSQYGDIRDVLQEWRVLSLEYEENDILLTVEIPAHLEQRIARFAQ